MDTIILTGGGTMGHISLNLALIDRLNQDFKRIIYIGSENGMEREILKDYKSVEYFPITTVKLQRSLTLKNLAIPYLLLKGKHEAENIIKQVKPSIIFSKGGFVSVPVVLAGKKLNIPIICHESDLSLGLANKLIKKRCMAVCTTFKETASKLTNGVYVGPYIKKQELSASERLRIKQKLNLNNRPILLIVGGSLGASALNNICLECLDEFLKTHQVLHITGKNKGTQIKKEGYTQVEFLPNLSSILPLCDLAITRGGSNMLFELLANNIPMLIIPLEKGSRGDQLQNARYFQSHNYGIMLEEKDLTKSNLLEKYKQLLSLSPILKNSNKNTLSFDGLEKIHSLILKYKI